MEIDTVTKPRPPIHRPYLVPRQTCHRSVVNTLRPVRRTCATKLLLVGRK